MKSNTTVQRLLSMKRGLILGFIIGVIVAPLLSTLGLMSPFFESLRPILIGPMLFVGRLIPDIQVAPNTFEVPVYKWFLALGFNGLCYAIPTVIIFLAVRLIDSKRQKE